MELSKLEKYKKQYKYFKNKIDLLKNYLGSTQGQTIIQPFNVSRALAVSELDAIFLLSLAEKENLLHKKFLVYTKEENNPLGEYDNSSSIPKHIFDDETGKEVYQDNYYIDIVFEIA